MTPAVTPAARTVSELFPRLASMCALASAAIGAVGVVFLVGMFSAFAIGDRSTGLGLGRINDVLILVSYPLIVPAMLVLRGRLRHLAPRTIDVATIVGLAAVAAITGLQLLLVRGILTFDEQIGWVSIAFAGFAAWLLAIGRVGSRSGMLPRGVRMGLVGATYLGFPAWALWVARRLADSATIRPSAPSAG